MAPSSIITKEGLNDERVIYEEASGYEPVPLIQTYKTGENGMVTIEVRAKKGHKFISPELQAVNSSATIFSSSLVELASWEPSITQARPTR